MDQIQAMRVFARVVESGTFTLAATSLQMLRTTDIEWVITSSVTPVSS